MRDEMAWKRENWLHEKTGVPYAGRAAYLRLARCGNQVSWSAPNRRLPVGRGVQTPCAGLRDETVLPAGLC